MSDAADRDLELAQLIGRIEAPLASQGYFEALQARILEALRSGPGQGTVPRLSSAGRPAGVSGGTHPWPGPARSASRHLGWSASTYRWLAGDESIRPVRWESSRDGYAAAG